MSPQPELPDPHYSAFVAEISIALISGGGLEVVLGHCADILCRHLSAAFARIWTLNKPEQVLELQASAGMYTNKNGRYSRIAVGQYEIGRIAKERQPDLTNAVIDHPHIQDHEWARREGMVAFAGYPLIVDGRVVGVMGVFARHVLSNTALEAMGAVANAIALAIDRQRAEDALRQREAQLAQLAERMATVREEERAKLAREIHDELGAELSLLKIDVTSVQRRTEGNKQVQDKIKSILKQLDDAILTIQRIAIDLRPPLLDTFGLGAAIDWYMDTNCERGGFDCEKDIDMELDVDASRATAIFRVFQEAFTNIIRHAGATKIMVQLKQDQAAITLVIKDNGVGIREGQTLTTNGLGFVCMRERLRPFEGTLTLVGRPQQGTTVTVMVPKRVGSQ